MKWERFKSNLGPTRIKVNLCRICDHLHKTETCFFLSSSQRKRRRKQQATFYIDRKQTITPTQSLYMYSASGS